MEKAWEFLSGKKTVIGAILLIVCGIPHLEELVGAKAIDIIYYIGTALSTTGMVHKLKKRNTK